MVTHCKTFKDGAGIYGSDAKDFDAIMYNAPYYLQVVSAGNDGE